MTSKGATRISKCRLCEENSFDGILDLGMQAYTGIFPKDRSFEVPVGPLELVKCKKCDLVQLAHSFDLGHLYGNNYGYRSGLNQSMVKHLGHRVEKLKSLVTLKKDDLVIDIGSNDSTLLRAYGRSDLKLIGIDPSAEKFRNYYPDFVTLITDFFSAKRIEEKVGKSQKAKVISSIAMFYDLESPIQFAREIADLLDDQGVWIFEQSYLPAMLATHSYDTVCHEHLEYYALKQIKWITDRVGLKILDVEFNDVNGGSFCITAAKKSHSMPENTALVQSILKSEEDLGLQTLGPYEKFRKIVETHSAELKKLLHDLKSKGKKVFGYGASTKGNVLLQYCGLSASDLPFIAEVNEEKFGAYTPGTTIPIISEKEAKQKKPDYLMVMPWHFKKGFIEREKDFLASGGHFIFPLPEIEIYPHEG